MKYVGYGLLTMMLFSINHAEAQSHKEAKAILAKASEELRSHKTVYLEFDYHFENHRVDPPIKQTEKCSIGIMGDNYHLNFMGTEQIRDGKKVYTILPEDEEVQVADFSEDEDEGITPSSILSLYDKGYSYKLGGTDSKDGKKIQYVILKPVASEEVDKIMIGVEKESHRLKSIKQWGTNGTITTFDVTSFQSNKSFPESYFKFNRKDYQDYYISE